MSHVSSMGKRWVTKAGIKQRSPVIKNWRRERFQWWWGWGEKPWEGARCGRAYLPPSQSHFFNPFKAQVLTIGKCPGPISFSRFYQMVWELEKKRFGALKYKENCKMKLLNISKGKLDESLSFCITKHCIFHVRHGCIFFRVWQNVGWGL